VLAGWLAGLLAFVVQKATTEFKYAISLADLISS
jgi:hypothetical protein